MVFSIELYVEVLTDTLSSVSACLAAAEDCVALFPLHPSVENNH